MQKEKSNGMRSFRISQVDGEGSYESVQHDGKTCERVTGGKTAGKQIVKLGMGT